MTGTALLLALLLQGGMSAWDTGRPGAPKEEWTAIGRDRTPDAFRGDAVLSNGRISARVRAADGTIELGEGASPRARVAIRGAAGDPIAKVSKLALVESSRAVLGLEVAGLTAKGAPLSARLRIKRGEVMLEAEPGPGAASVRVEAPGRFLVLPDFFADDIVVDAARLPGPAAEIPSENLLLQPTGSGDALVVTVFEHRDQDARITLSGEGGARRIDASEVSFGGPRKVWVGILAEPGIWHSVEVRAEDANRVVPLEWTMPYLAAWRVELTRPNGLTDSWDMLLQPRKGHEYVKPAWFGGPAEKVNDATRRRFTEVLGFFPYPAWSDPERRGYLQPLEIQTRTKFVPVLSYRGPALLYPFNRVPETPADRYTLVDVARAALGVGPCEYLLDVEGQKQTYQGVATCTARDLIAEIYARGEQKTRRAEVLKALDQALAFVTHIRGRIEVYLEFGRKTRAYLAKERRSRPDLAAAIDELDRIAQEMDARFEERKEKIGTPEHVARLNEEFRKGALEAEGAEAEARVKAYGEALTRVGGNQDKLVSECRWVARTLRQQAALLVARDPRLAPVAAELRTRTQAILKNPAYHERARQ